MSVFNINSVISNCSKYWDVILGQNNLVKNTDGTLSAYMNSVSGKKPYHISKTCCEVLRDTTGEAYYYDLDSQKCRWKTPTIDCVDIEPIKIVLNPKGNDGSIFKVDEDEICSLEVNFEYLFKINCNTLANTLNTQTVYDPKLDEDIRNLQTDIELQTVMCSELASNISELSTILNNTNYSIVCESFPIGGESNLGAVSAKEAEPVVTKMTEKETAPFTKTAFGGGLAPFSIPQVFYTTKTFCLTEPLGLNAWGDILGANRFQSFLNADSDSYTCDDVIALYNQNQLIPLTQLNANKLLFECSTPFGTKTTIKVELDSLIEQKNSCSAKLTELQTQLDGLLALQSEQGLRCGTPVDVLENLDVSMSIDVIEPDGSLTSVYQYDVLPAIGTGNLYNYLLDRPTDSGFYICGEPNSSENWATGCTNMYFDEFSSDIKPEDIEPNVTSCLNVKNSIFNGLYVESGLNGVENGLEEFKQSLQPTILSSEWVKYNTLITDEAVIQQITNRKIKLSLTVNSTCGDFCVLIDQITLDKVCDKIDTDTIFLSKSPGFNLTRVIDNKKSWIENDSFVNRQFNIGNSNNLNQIRQTDYSINDERLIINSKEIDLDISMASAVEYDTWCYLNDNPCILTGQTLCDPCVDYGLKEFQDSWCFGFQDDEEYIYQDGFTGYGYFKSVCCGDNQIDFDLLTTTSLSKIQTFDKFKEVITSELIDVKNRQTISKYATLRALYDRYLDSQSYCNTKSAAFDYYTMEQFANLIGDYWVDLIEQVIPATTIWGSVKIYTNTLFDQQKFRYKSYSSLFCENVFINTNVLSPVSKCNCADVSVSTTIINLVNDNGTPQKTVTNTCNTLCIAQMNSGSEFIGTVKGPIDCVVSSWSDWSDCSVDGTKTRTRVIEVQPEYGGVGCPVLTETTTCPIDCVMSDWSDWSACSLDGTKTRTRTVITPALNGGVECGPLEEIANCPVDCVVSDWSDWSDCVNRERTKTRTIITQPLNGGVGCPILSITESCGPPVPPIFDQPAALYDGTPGGTYTYTGTVSDPDAPYDILIVSVLPSTPLPIGWTFSQTPGTNTFTITGPVPVGSDFTITLQVNDLDNPSNFTQQTLYINTVFATLVDMEFKLNYIGNAIVTQGTGQSPKTTSPIVLSNQPQGFDYGHTCNRAQFNLVAGVYKDINGGTWVWEDLGKGSLNNVGASNQTYNVYDSFIPNMGALPFIADGSLINQQWINVAGGFQTDLLNKPVKAYNPLNKQTYYTHSNLVSNNNDRQSYFDISPSKASELAVSSNWVGSPYKGVVKFKLIPNSFNANGLANYHSNSSWLQVFKKNALGTNQEEVLLNGNSFLLTSSVVITFNILNNTVTVGLT